MQGVPTNPVQKDEVYKKTGLLAKKLGILDRKEVRIAGLPANRGVLNKKLLTCDHPNSIYHGFELDPKKFLSYCSAYDKAEDISFQPGNIEWAMQKRIVHDISIFSLDYCGALKDEEELEDIIEGVRACAVQGLVLVQLTYTRRRDPSWLDVPDYFSQKMGEINQLIGPDYYMGNTAMQVLHLVVNNGATRRVSSIDEMIDTPTKPIQRQEVVPQTQLTLNTGKDVKEAMDSLGITTRELVKQLKIADSQIYFYRCKQGWNVELRAQTRNNYLQAFSNILKERE